ncbi:MAG: DHA2 family efflux MFS transporter permease subunit [Sphingomonadales bacterium]|nr:DHA2 family efflux MFS transporter permease subunit [Sphingomonadales bacterium]
MAGPAPLAKSDPGALDAWKLIPANRRFLAGLVLALSNFMVVLDLTIANVSVPHISGNLGISLDQGTWIITSYAVAEAICVPLTGWLAQRFGTVRVFVWAMIGFGFFSLLCGLSPTLGVIVAARIGQGLCGGPIMPMSQTLLVRVFPPEKRAMAMALWAMTVTAGPAAGPIIGGVISDQISWHWIFFINLPVAAICVAGAWMLLRPVETSTQKLPIDKVGLGLLVFWIGCLQIMLDIGRDHDWFADWRILALAIMAGIGFCVFLIWELTEEHPVVDLRVFRHRGFSAVVVTQALSFGAFFAGVVVVPQWLQSSLGYSATKAGLVTAAHAFAAVITSRFVAQLLPKVDPRLLVSLGVLWMGVTSIFRAFWTSDADFFSLTWPMFAQGIGIPMMMIPLTTMALSSVQPAETASAAGLQNFVRTMSTAIATSVVLTVWGNAQSNARANLVGNLHEGPTRASLAHAGFSPMQATAYIDQLVQREAVTLAVNHVFWVAASFSFAAALLVWFTPRIALTRIGAPPAGGH